MERKLLGERFAAGGAPDGDWVDEVYKVLPFEIVFGLAVLLVVRFEGEVGGGDGEEGGEGGGEEKLGKGGGSGVEHRGGEGYNRFVVGERIGRIAER